MAAHDLSDLSGNPSSSDCSYTVGVEQIFSHPGYAQSGNDFDQDVALFRLDSPVSCSDHVSPVCLPQDTAESYTGRTATVSGWGTLDPVHHLSTVQ